jgi:hypothetical protein
MSAPRRAQVAAWHHGRVEGIEVRPLDVQVQVAPGIKIENACDPANGPSKKGPSSWDDPMELKGPPAFKKRAKALLMAYDLSGHCKALEKSQRAASRKETRRDGRWVCAKHRYTHRSPPRGSPPRQVPAFRPLAIPYRGPGALAGGPEGAHERDARTADMFRRRLP